VGRKTVIAPMPGDEGNGPRADAPDGDDVARRPVRSSDFYLFRVIEKGVKARTADDADICASDHGAEISRCPGAAEMPNAVLWITGSAR
jgi:hypothetical protein